MRNGMDLENTHNIKGIYVEFVLYVLPQQVFKKVVKVMKKQI